MPTINPSTVPLVAPGSLFSRFTGSDEFNIRWLVATDPAYYEVLNRPHADIALRQLTMAKAVDLLQVRLGHQAVFPFVFQPLLDLGGTSTEPVPLSWIWDLNVSLPKKWNNIRLSKIKRISGTNADSSTGAEYTGYLRLIFTGQDGASTAEVAIFQADYQIDSQLRFQRSQVTAVSTVEESVAISTGEAATIAGDITFNTLDVDDTDNQSFFTVVAPPVPGTEDSSGFFLVPAVYETQDNPAGGATEEDDFAFGVFEHGSGMLTDSAISKIPSLNSDVNTWITAFNYPFRSEATRTASSPLAVTIPQTIFDEFQIIAPDGDNPTGDTSGNYFPVYISKVIRDDANADSIRFVFATYNTSDTPSSTPIDFASLTLSRDDVAQAILAIDPIDDLFPLITDTSNSINFRQGFGHGHVRLSSKWGVTDGEVDAFFDALTAVAGDEVTFVFPMGNATLSSFAVNRVPKTIPTRGESEALTGSTAGLQTPVYPSDSNRYVCEADQGLGDQIDFSAAATGLPEAKRENPSIERYGWTGALTHKLVKLVIDASDSTIDYDTDILPRLVILLGRNPIFGDGWYNGSRFVWYNGDDWIG